MRILVMSDSHGNVASIKRAIAEQPDANVIIHLGDCAKDLDLIANNYPSKKFVKVTGNNDFFSLLPYDETVVFDNTKIFCTHGHKQYVKSTLDYLKASARQNHCTIAIFGHTHKPLVDYDDGLYILNPGSVGGVSFDGATYGTIDITKNGIVCNIIKLK